MACRWSCTNNSFTNDSFANDRFTNNSVITLTKVIWMRVPKSPQNVFCDLFKRAFKPLYLNLSIKKDGSIQIAERNA